MSKSNLPSQNEIVLDYIITHGAIDTVTAIEELHILRLGARINNLKKLGYKFKTTLIYRKNSEGRVSRWAKYQFEE